ncbi:MAG: alpha/beta fold hydrolase [Archangium sp.]
MRLSICLFLMLAACATVDRRFDARLTDFEYPFPVSIFEFEGQQLAFMDVQPETPNGQTVLLLHGKNFSGASWERTARELLKRGYRVVMPDQIGFGKSSKPTAFQYSFAVLAHSTHELLMRRGISKAIVVGHSMGGMVATRFTVMFPDAVTRLVLVNPIGLEDWSAVVPYAPVSVAYREELARTPDQVRQYMSESYFDGKWEPAYDAFAAIQLGWATSADKPTLAMVSALTADMVFTQPVVNDFPRITAPTLLIIGTRDRTAIGKGRASAAVKPTLGRYDLLGKRANAAIPGSKLVEIDGVRPRSAARGVGLLPRSAHGLHSIATAYRLPSASIVYSFEPMPNMPRVARNSGLPIAFHVPVAGSVTNKRPLVSTL